MAQLAADLNIEVVSGTAVEIAVPAIAATFYQGGLVFLLAAGGNVTNVAVDTGDIHCMGMVLKKQVIATAGDLLSVMIKGYVWCPIATTLDTDNSKSMSLVYVDDSAGTASMTDSPVDLINNGDTALAASDVIVGRVVRATATQMLIAIDVAGLTGSNTLATGAATLA